MPTTPTPADRPADQLRAAAEKLREEAARAHRASPAPWTVTDEHVVRCADGMIVADRSGTDHPAERADLPYIALMHPGVGLALAAWLDTEAATWAGDEVHNSCSTQSCTFEAALAVARQLLGTTEGEGERLAQSGVSTPGCDCGHDGMGPAWHLKACTWRTVAAPPAPADRAATGAEWSTLLNQAADRMNPAWFTDEATAAAAKATMRRLADEAPVSAPLVARLGALAAEWERRGRYGDSGLTDRARELRAVLADDAAAGVQPPTTTEAHRPCVEYIAEVLENDGVWMYLGADPDPAVATRRRASVIRRHPDAETRTVRKTTTYTVEPEPAAPAAPEETR